MTVLLFTAFATENAARQAGPAFCGVVTAGDLMVYLVKFGQNLTLRNLCKILI
ncbi:MAG: hypothetical protein AAF557_14300 [Pseudomonadota bacterium]